MTILVLGVQNVVLLYVLSYWKENSFSFFLLVLGWKRVAFVLEMVSISLKHLSLKTISSSVTTEMGLLCLLKMMELSSAQIFSFFVVVFSFCFWYNPFSGCVLELCLWQRTWCCCDVWLFAADTVASGLSCLELMWILASINSLLRTWLCLPLI